MTASGPPEPAQASPFTAEALGVARSYDDLRRIVAGWCDYIGMTRAELDAEAGLGEGHGGKLLSAKARKKLGMVTLGRVMAAAGLVIVVAVDPEFTARAIHANGNASGYRAKHWRRNRGSAWGRRMAALRTLKQSTAERSASARKAAQARWQRRQAALTTPSSDAE